MHVRIAHHWPESPRATEGIHPVQPADAGALRAHVEIEGVAARAHLAEATAMFDDRAWRRDHTGDGAYPEDTLWAAAAPLSNSMSGSASLAPDRKSSRAGNSPAWEPLAKLQRRTDIEGARFAILFGIVLVVGCSEDGR
jgi:hypothetical protein